MIVPWTDDEFNPWDISWMRCWFMGLQKCWDGESTDGAGLLALIAGANSRCEHLYFTEVK